MYENQGKVVRMKLGGTVGRGCFVKGDGTTAGQVVIAAAEGDATIGVCVEGGVAGDFKPICLDGMPEVAFGGSVDPWGPIEVDSAGKAVAAAGAGAHTVGYAPEGGASGTYAPAIINLPAVKGPANS